MVWCGLCISVAGQIFWTTHCVNRLNAFEQHVNTHPHAHMYTLKENRKPQHSGRCAAPIRLASVSEEISSVAFHPQKVTKRSVLNIKTNDHKTDETCAGQAAFGLVNRMQRLVGLCVQVNSACGHHERNA